MAQKMKTKKARKTRTHPHSPLPWSILEIGEMYATTDPMPDYGVSISAGDGETLVAQRVRLADAQLIVRLVNEHAKPGKSSMH